MDELLKEGTQVIYVPRHADGKITHPDCQYGFVTSLRGDLIFCRFWREGTYKPFDDQEKSPELRTTANSEACDRETLVVMDYIQQRHIDKTLRAIKDGTLEI
jgi:hypothetical protein